MILMARGQNEVVIIEHLGRHVQNPLRATVKAPSLTHQLLNRHLATASLVPRSPCSSLLVASPHPYSSRAEVNDWKCWAVNQSNVESYFY